MSQKQKTIKKAIVFKGIGLHTGQEAMICLKPAPVNTGICFKRIDLDGAPEMKVSVENVRSDNMSGRCSIIGKGDSAIQTIEHLMAAIFGFGIDNVLIEINGLEVPGMDGSALPFGEEIDEVGLQEQEGDRKYIILKRPISVSAGNASITIFPSDDFKVTYVLDYEHSMLKSQVFNFSLGDGTFLKEIAPARTFCLKEEADALRKAGFGKGANYQNTLVMDHKGPVDNKMRLDQECARHKVLDLIGDMSFLGRPIKGHVVAVRSGHYLNACLVKAIDDQNEKIRFQERPPDSDKIQAAADIFQIMKALPHRYPFLLVDRIVEVEAGKRAVGIKNLTMNELFFQGHFPQKPIMPGVLMIEAMAQVGGILLKTTEMHREQVGLFMAVNNTKFRRTASPGDQLVMEVDVVRDRARTAAIHGVGRVDGEVVVEADMMFSFMDANEFFN
jgi:UDP-3-O-[3-hydroxymyristoyl] N-acetylglucosamine deacetylase/3-hydroxyacyl-[acyl-carrier-protein] dehydratase